ncbi:DSBA-like thioredoxin domain protein [Synechococcus sp. PCC 7335]|uniref:DsbA family protein n=1 Tax=Synechococcus sp. (strain ATCC 29403 / PCC 7335) TaxID=91464 RepID=UPI00017EC3E2|nr:DsbA family protein [Synechococcus sp. PCC 7335]EDX87808.1 DSBA-like thioredoxin domain protein [Synechococcus sp. PCC 7335]
MAYAWADSWQSALSTVRRVVRSAGRYAIALTLLGLAACGNPSTEDVASSQVVEPTEEASPEAAPTEEEVAAMRAEWEARMAKVQSVVDETPRDELIASSATKGPRDAKVMVLKFSDFQCPYCAVAAASMKTFAEAHDEDVLYVYKQLPLVSIHPEAEPAAKASWAAGQQGQFWLYHDGLFAFQDRLGEDYYVELAEQIGLDIEKFNQDRNSPEAEAAINQDIQLAKALEIRGTPNFLVTNTDQSFLFPGNTPLEVFEEATDRLSTTAP